MSVNQTVAKAADILSNLPGLPSGVPPRSVTGDRPTGPLHLGHLAGSLLLRVALQEVAPQTVLVADLQALTDNARTPGRVARNVCEVVADYLAVGIDPARCDIVLQSSVPELAELAFLLMNVVTVARCERNPTLKEEIRSRGFDRSLPLGFLAYPVSQAADILGLAGGVVPVGADQLPMVEQANEVADSLALLAGKPVFHRCVPLLTSTPRLPGADGRKASKSLGNALALSADRGMIAAFVRSMYTDPGHVRKDDPGQVDGNVVFAHLDAFDPDADEVADLKLRYARGGLGDQAVKARLVDVLDRVLLPVRERRSEVMGRLDFVESVLEEGTERARETAAQILDGARNAFGIGRRFRH